MSRQEWLQAVFGQWIPTELLQWQLSPTLKEPYGGHNEMSFFFFFFSNVPQGKATQQAAKFGNVWCCVDWSTACLLWYILVGPVLCSLHDTLSQSLHQSWLITVHFSETTIADTVISRFTVCYISKIFLYLSLINMLSSKSKSTLFVSYLHDMAYRSLNCVEYTQYIGADMNLQRVLDKVCISRARSIHSLIRFCA